MVSHHMVKPTLTMVLAMKTRKTTKALTRRFRKAWKKELQWGQERDAGADTPFHPRKLPLNQRRGCRLPGEHLGSQWD